MGTDRTRQPKVGVAMESQTTDDADRAQRSTPTRPVKRSFTIAGHRTSISLEAAFWDALCEIAEEEKRSLSSIVGEIDGQRGTAGLSGAVRIWVLDRYRQKAADKA